MFLRNQLGVRIDDIHIWRKLSQIFDQATIMQILWRKHAKAALQSIGFQYFNRLMGPVRRHNDGNDLKYIRRA